MNKDDALKLALEALELYPVTVNHWKTVLLPAAQAIREALADSALERMAENARELGLDYEPPCKTGSQCTSKCQQCEQPAQQQEPEPDRVKFERHWRKTRGDKKANRELPRHPLQPQTYIQDSANRHWVTWQAAVRSVAPPASKPWVGLSTIELDEIDAPIRERGHATVAEIYRAIEAKLREKNT